MWQWEKKSARDLKPLLHCLLGEITSHWIQVAYRSRKSQGNILLEPAEKMQPYLQFGCRASDLQNHKIIICVLLSDQVYGDLLQQQQETNT